MNGEFKIPKMKYLIAFMLISSVLSEEFSRNCEDIQSIATRKSQNATSGIYKIYPTKETNRTFEVFCDMATDNGGWLVIQRRRESDYQMDFYRNMNEYANGFGLLQDSHWIGLDIIHALTNSDNYKLRINMMAVDGEERYAEYDFFRVANSSDFYRLQVEGFNGNAGDSLTVHSGMAFSTKDLDNDSYENHNCAVVYHGAWWYRSCHMSNLNGLYGSVDYGVGINWRSWKGDNYSLKRVEMKIRTTTYRSNFHE